MIRQYELVERVRGYDPGVDEALLNRAYVYAMRMHGSQKRASGDPYFSHPIEVAGILTDMKLDVDTIVTALLHDTLEDTDATRADIDQKFGTGIGRLVDGVTKLTRIELQSDQTKQAENFRKFFLAMSEDIRVLLVKLADRTHNMRTLHFIENAEKRKRIAAETLEIYAPLAERVGLRAIKDELEDLAFIELHREVRDSICARLDYLGSEETETVEQIIEELGRVCAENGVASAVSGRRKSPYSIWNKMQRKHASLEQLSDIMAFRVIVDSLEDCYKALGIIHANYQVVPGRFNDFISIPKANGYSSLHTGVMGPRQQRIEVQIRTHKMHEIAEKGVAAHWNYKEGATDGQQPKWLNDLLEILESAEGPEDFLEHTKLEMYVDQVFCFTPKGDLIALPRGATAIDFAYAVHTDVGHTCVGTKVNGRIRPLATHLQNGDQVEVLVSRTSTPTPGWIDICATGRARAPNSSTLAARSSPRPFVRPMRVFRKIAWPRSVVSLAPRRRRICWSISAPATKPPARYYRPSCHAWPAPPMANRWRRSPTPARPAKNNRRCRSTGSPRAWPCIWPAVATPYLATGALASSPPAKAW